MAHLNRPSVKPSRPSFSSGPCPKRPGWTVDALKNAVVGRSHRSPAGRAKLTEAIDRTRALLRIPDDYRVGIVPASDTGAVELALWSLLGARGVDVLAWDNFGKTWLLDILTHLGLEDVRAFEAAPGELPELSAVDFSRDVVFTWNGTTTGVRVPNDDWIRSDRAGLTVCDATSAVFAHALDWTKLDVVTYSWQKVLGSEAGHGMLILSPRAVERLETFQPDRPLPKIFRLTKNGKILEDIFRGVTINTPSMLCVEDYLDALSWADRIGGLDTLILRSQTNAQLIAQWIERTPWVEHLCRSPDTRSHTSVCISIIDPRFTNLDETSQRSFIERLVFLLEEEGVAFDIASYRDSPPGLRIWCGATVDAADIQALMPWIEWAYQTLHQSEYGGAH